jgi:TonB family protein
MTVVVFWLPSSGIPSNISIKSSSGSDALDSATISCVSKLRFAAATTLGDGNPIDSWQQVGFSWANRADGSHGQPNDVIVRACVDGTGKLEQAPTIVHSSGVASLDEAALKIAESGSAYYRPDSSPNGPPVSGCAQLAIKFDTK